MQMEPSRSAQAHRAVVALVVEDDPSVRAIWSRWLTESGRHVVACPTFQEAKEYLAFHTPDVLITDVRLRDYNGLQLVMQVADQNTRAICIVITGHDDLVLRREAERFNARYLLKPIDRADFLAAVENLPPSNDRVAPSHYRTSEHVH
jgi:DNA-binding NtrC family response regulator